MLEHAALAVLSTNQLLKEYCDNKCS